MTSSALEHILKQHHEDAFLWARQCCSFDEDQAKDVLQAVYLKILEGKAKFNEKSSPKTWLFSVIRYTAIDQFKKGMPLESLDNYHGLEADVEVGVEEPRENYEKLIKQLSPMQGQVLLMVFYHHMTLEECAQVLQVGIGTARTHYDRGKKRLKQMILKTQEQI
ncbi:RNA polymerase sigma factor [Algoriphagus sediminis]|uniref:RNA polymerase sigma factor n=1 Tax=Algoriphagus sediminis TaxID=3057113 RepID=A0ABT7YFH7_9BACT|nr:RNA polymerase sigma factor [Algoriphagus sediminis]MDN3205279.1 RNA polymerase sigma factor [Algoriphagus sediminis]